MIIPQFNTEPTVVVYTKRTGGNYYMLITEKDIDVVNNSNARKPIIPLKYKFIELGIGKSFISPWMKKYKIEKFEVL